jgi:cytochrome c5
MISKKFTLWAAATVAATALAAGQTQTPPLPEGEGKQILESACTVCHTLKEVTKFKGFYSRENWRDIVQTMIADGASLKDAQIPTLIDYLTKAFPRDFPDGEGKKLLDTACSGCHPASDVRRFDGYYGKNQWNDMVRVMVANGAPLNEDQIPILVDYLTATFPVMKTPNATSR